MTDRETFRRTWTWADGTKLRVAITIDWDDVSGLAYKAYRYNAKGKAKAGPITLKVEAIEKGEVSK